MKLANPNYKSYYELASECLLDNKETTLATLNGVNDTKILLAATPIKEDDEINGVSLRTETWENDKKLSSKVIEELIFGGHTADEHAYEISFRARELIEKLKEQEQQNNKTAVRKNGN